MIITKLVCKIHKIIKDAKLVPCEIKCGICPECKKEGTNYGFKTAIFTEN